ncbi:hypothetical protein MUO79_03165 [Candidatus Bathyarchaeota archaeon]|nr:hypothetical protein [Candidatus Bathyarchaeota archaeon]
MKTDQNAYHKPLDYGVGALVVLVISVGLAAIVYSVNMIPFDLFNIPAWIFGPFGVYTLAYSFVARKESTYYLVWGTVMFAVAIIFAFYNVVNPVVILGILAIVIAIIGIVAYQRSKK